MPTLCAYWVCHLLSWAPGTLGAKVATLQCPGGSTAEFCAGTVWWGGGHQVACVCSDKLALPKPQSGPAHASPGPLQSLPVLGGIFYKIPFRLCPNCFFLISLSVMNQVRRLHTPWEGIWHGSQLDWVRVGAKQKGRHYPGLVTISQEWALGGEMKGGATGVSQGHTVGREALGQSQCFGMCLWFRG